MKINICNWYIRIEKSKVKRYSIISDLRKKICIIDEYEIRKVKILILNLQKTVSIWNW